MLISYNYDDLEKTVDGYNADHNVEVIYIHKNFNEWMALSLSEAEKLIKELMILTRRLNENIGSIKPFHLQSEEYRKGTAEAIRDEN